MASKKTSKQYKPKFTAAERRAYWIGVGRSFAAGDANAKLSANAFAENLSEKEDRSYQQGLFATARNPYMFEKNKRER